MKLLAITSLLAAWFWSSEPIFRVCESRQDDLAKMLRDAGLLSGKPVRSTVVNGKTIYFCDQDHSWTE